MDTNFNHLGKTMDTNFNHLGKTMDTNFNHLGKSSRKEAVCQSLSACTGKDYFFPVL